MLSLHDSAADVGHVMHLHKPEAQQPSFVCPCELGKFMHESCLRHVSSSTVQKRRLSLSDDWLLLYMGFKRSCCCDCSVQLQADSSASMASEPTTLNYMHSIRIERLAEIPVSFSLFSRQHCTSLEYITDKSSLVAPRMSICKHYPVPGHNIL